MSWMKFKGISSEDIEGVIVNSIPLYSPPAERITFIEIEGRDGDLSKSQDAFEAYEANAELTITEPDRRQAVFDWLRGSGLLETSHAMGYAVKARVVNRIDPEKIIPAVNKIRVTFHIQPFLYEADPEVITLTASGCLNNPGTRKALPIISVVGSGVLTVAGEEITVSANGFSAVIINSDIQECYTADGTSVNNLISFATGEFPVIQPGLFDVVLGEGITSIEFQGNWRWF